MKTLSEESILLAKNWETFQEILKAEQKLIEDISVFLLSVESEMLTKKWWQNGWNFVDYEGSEIYIANQNWISNYEEYVISIGIEGVTPESLFGNKRSPLLYVKSSDYNLVKTLAEKLEEEETLKFGEIDYSSRRYIVTQPLPKVLPEQVEKFDEVVRPQIVDFLSYYANILWELDEIIDQFLS